MRALEALRLPALGPACWLVLRPHSGLCSESLETRQGVGTFFFVTDPEKVSIVNGGRKPKAVERMKPKTKPAPAPRKPEPATPGAIREAIEALTREDTERIEQSALNRINRIWRAANGRSHDDLMQEALIRILDGKRRWYNDKTS